MTEISEMDYKEFLEMIKKQQSEIDNLMFRVMMLEDIQNRNDIQKAQAKEQEKHFNRVWSENWENECLNG